MSKLSKHSVKEPESNRIFAVLLFDSNSFSLSQRLTSQRLLAALFEANCFELFDSFAFLFQPENLSKEEVLGQFEAERNAGLAEWISTRLLPELQTVQSLGFSPQCVFKSSRRARRSR